MYKLDIAHEIIARMEAILSIEEKIASK